MDYRDPRDMSRKRKSISPSREKDGSNINNNSTASNSQHRVGDHPYRNRDGSARGPPVYRGETQQGASNHHHSHHSHHSHNHNGAIPPSTSSSSQHQQHQHQQMPHRFPPSGPPASAGHASNPPPASSTQNGPSNYDKYKSLSEIKYPYMTDFGEYERQTKIGQGTFGEVFKAKCRKTGRTVALKKILMENEKEGFPITALREIKILQQFKDANVVELFDICSSKASDFNRYRSTFYLVFEFCEHDLAGLLSNSKVQFKEGETKTIMKQLLDGLFYIHAGKVLHRDMKTSNILINKDGVLKIADFGLARAFSQLGTKEKPNRFTNRVVTLWYRPPELLLGDRNYTPAIDVWGAACIMCELWTRSPILQGQNEQHQLLLITQFCGSISPDVYPDVASLELYKTLELPKDVKRALKERLSRHIKDPLALDLIDKLFTINPLTRPDCDAALNHDYFWSDPMPQNLLTRMKTLSTSNFEFTANTNRQQVQQQPGNRAPSQAAVGHNGPGPGGFFRDRVF